MVEKTAVSLKHGDITDRDSSEIKEVFTVNRLKSMLLNVVNYFYLLYCINIYIQHKHRT